MLCFALAAGGLALTAANFGSAITGLYAFGLFLGTIYSVPPLRLKRFAIPAFLIIATVRPSRAAFGAEFICEITAVFGLFQLLSAFMHLVGICSVPARSHS